MTLNHFTSRARQIDSFLLPMAWRYEFGNSSTMQTDPTASERSINGQRSGQGTRLAISVSRNAGTVGAA
jgi:hypothetical protein